jgi:hypothetical protein
VRNRALAFRHMGLQYWAVEQRGRKCSPHWLLHSTVRHAHLVRCLFGKTRRRHPCAPNAGMRCGLPASSRQCGRCLGWSSTYAEVADTSEPPNASPIPHHRSGSDRRAAYDIPCFVANANDPDMDDQPKTRLICSRCAARMKLAAPRQVGRSLRVIEKRTPGRGVNPLPMPFPSRLHALSAGPRSPARAKDPDRERPRLLGTRASRVLGAKSLAHHSRGLRRQPISPSTDVSVDRASSGESIC